VARKIAILDAPSNLGLRPLFPGHEPGVRRMPDALRVAGIVAALGAKDAGRVSAPPYSPERDQTVGVRNAPAITAFSRSLAPRIEDLLESGYFPLVLGGDCSILLGTTLALRRRGRYGLVYLDGHLDFRRPGFGVEMEAAAGEVLALITGHGPALLADIEGRRPLVREEDVVALGFRAGEDQGDDSFGVRDTAIVRIGVRDLREDGPEAAARRAVGILERPALDGFWIHVDADVLDQSLMPAVDSPEPDGLDFDELAGVLRVLAGSDVAVGVNVTIFDPDKDPSGGLARELTRAIVGGLGQRRH
jgi:arginase